MIIEDGREKIKYFNIIVKYAEEVLRNLNTVLAKFHI